ncbi:MAG: TonB-dependent receptor [Flavobacteriaceae bacterium]
MKKNKLKFTLAALGLFCVNLLLAQSTLSGSVTDAETNEPLPGVNIVIQGTGDGTNTDFDGNFTFTTNSALPFTLEISSVGFSSQSIEVTSADQTINVSLQPGENLQEIIVSASRRAQKIQDAPSSVSIISSKDIENSAIAVDPVRHLVNIPGVQIQQQSANTLNIEMRAGSGVFGTSTFPILDYRFLSTPAAGTFFTQHSGLSNIDIEKIEVVRGAASALYGPNVVSGVVHFMSKSSIDHPGTTVELLGGEMSTVGAAVRHAYASEDKKFGYKINAKWSSGNDFELDPIEDADQIAQFKQEIYQPAISNGYVDGNQTGTLLLDMDDLDDNNDGNPLATKYDNISANAHLEFRPNDNTTGFISGGFAKGGAIFFNSQGEGRQDGEDYWAQARVQSGGLFALLSYNHKTGGGEGNPTFLYRSGFRQVAINSSLEAQVQYNFDMPGFLDSNVTVGFDHRDVTSDSQNTLFGRNELVDDYVITGLYLQATSKLSDKLELTYAARADKFTVVDDIGFSPRVALVYKLDDNNSIRASYNSSASIPTALQSYIDFPVNVILPGVYDVWLAGEIEAQNFDPNAPIRLPFLGNLEVPQGTGAIPNAYIFGALNALGAGAGAIDAINTNPDYAGLIPFQGVLESVLNNPATAASITGSSGFLGSPYGAGVGYNIFNGERLDPTDTGSALINTVNSFEIGYKGVIAKKLSLAVDFYTYEQKGFTNFTAIGPAFAYTPDTDPTGPLATSIATDLAPLLTPGVTDALTAAYTANAALIPGIDAATLIANGFAGIPGVVDPVAPLAVAAAQVIGGLAAVGGGTYALGQNLIPAAALPVFGAINSERAPDDGLTHLAAGYRKFDNQSRTHWGMDIAAEYFANENISFWANASYLSQNVWIPGESDDDGLPFSSYLNAPQFKYRAGVKYNKNNWLASLSFQHDDEFESNQGFYSGTVQKKNLFDANVGVYITPKVRFDLTGSNIFNFEYRAFPSMPVIGRRIIGKITFDL